jgi:hypothetical protein
MYILGWLLWSTAIYTLFDRGTLQVSSSKTGSRPYFHRAIRVGSKGSSALPLDWSSRTSRLPFDEVAPKIPGSDNKWFIFMRHSKDLVYVAPLPADIGELKWHISKAAASVSVDMLEQVWHEMGCSRRLPYDRRDTHQVAVKYDTSFHSSSIKQCIYSRTL